MMSKKILILTGGPRVKLESFAERAEVLGMDVTLASFYDLEFVSKEKSKTAKITVLGEDLNSFGLIYIRMVGKRWEDATLVVNYAKEKDIKIVDGVYRHALFIPSTISKWMEMKKLIEGGLPVPPVYFGSLRMIMDNAKKHMGYPFVVKSTSGKKARDVWIADSDADVQRLYSELRPREIKGDRFFAQELIKASQRIRVLVVNGNAIGAITRPTKYRKRWTKKVGGEYPEGKKENLVPVAEKYADVATKAAVAADLDISGVDILEEDKTGNLYIIEANAAPSWKLIAKDPDVCVEEKILKFLKSKLRK